MLVDFHQIPIFWRFSIEKNFLRILKSFWVNL